MVGKYSIYVTNGPDAYKENVEYGGDHITVAKKQEFKGAALEKIVSEVATHNLGNEPCPINWRPKKWEIKQWGVGKNKADVRYIMVISSDRLEEVAEQLSKKGVNHVMGPGNGKAKFHVTLPKRIASKDAAEQYAKNLVDDKAWFLSVVDKKHKCQRLVNVPLMQPMPAKKPVK